MPPMPLGSLSAPPSPVCWPLPALPALPAEPALGAAPFASPASALDPPALTEPLAEPPSELPLLPPLLALLLIGEKSVESGELQANARPQQSSAATVRSFMNAKRCTRAPAVQDGCDTHLDLPYCVL